MLYKYMDTTHTTRRDWFQSIYLLDVALSLLIYFPPPAAISQPLLLYYSKRREYSRGNGRTILFNVYVLTAKIHPRDNMVFFSSRGEKKKNIRTVNGQRARARRIATFCLSNASSFSLIPLLRHITLLLLHIKKKKKRYIIQNKTFSPLCIIIERDSLRVHLLSSLSLSSIVSLSLYSLYVKSSHARAQLHKILLYIFFVFAHVVQFCNIIFYHALYIYKKTQVFSVTIY